MKMKYDLSVIIPVYNCEKYILKCIKSILNNKCKLQIIVIDDCSTDNTLKELDKVKQYINIIKLKMNTGVSHARNVGLQKVKSNYFTFIDSDDYIEKNTFDTIFNLKKDNDIDMICYNYYEVNDLIKIKSKYVYNNEILDKKNTIKKMLNNEVPLVVWNKIYKFDMYKDILFNEEFKINEDYEYSLRVIARANKVLFVNKYLYYHYKNSSSLTTKYTCKLIKESNYLEKLDKKTLELYKNYKEYIYFCCRDSLRQIHLYSQCKDKKNRYTYLKTNIDNKNLKRLLKYNISKGNKIEILLYLISIKLHLLLFPVYLKIRNSKRKI